MESFAGYWQKLQEHSQAYPMLPANVFIATGHSNYGWNAGLTILLGASYNRLAMRSLNTLFGMAWLFSGLIWLRRAMADEARPNALTGLFTQPEMQTDKDRRWKLRIGILYVMLGAFYLVSAIFPHGEP